MKTPSGQLDICLKPRLKSLGVEIINYFPPLLCKNIFNKYVVLFYDQREAVVNASGKKDGIKRTSFQCCLVMFQETLEKRVKNGGGVRDLCC